LTIPSSLPLAGKRVVVTRAPEQAEELVRRLHQLGAEVLLLPAVRFGEPEDSAPLDQAILGLESFDWIVFTSANAVRFLIARCRALRLDRWLGAEAEPLDSSAKLRAPKLAAVGPATAEALEKEGLRALFVSGTFRGEALAAELGPQLAGKRVLLPRSDRSNDLLPAALRAAGAEVVNVVAYRTSAPGLLSAEAAGAVVRGDVDVLTFLSPSAFHHLADEFGIAALLRLSSRVALAAIGPTTAAAIREAGLPVEIEAREATPASLVAAIHDYYAQRQPSGVKSP